MKKIITLTALLCTMCLMFSCHDTSPAPMLLNGQYVESLDEAIAAMKAGDTLQVTRDLDVEAPIAVDKEITIELLGGAKIEYDGEGSAFDIKEGGSLVIKGQSAGSGKSGMYRSSAAGGTVIEADGPVEALFKVGPGATLELENVTLIGENKDNYGLIWFDNPEDVTSELVTKVILTNVNAVADKSIICPTYHYEATAACAAAGGCSHPMNADIVIKGGKFTRTGTALDSAILRKTIFVVGSKLTMEDAEIVSAISPGVEISGSYLADAYPSYYGHNAGTSSIKNCTITNKATAGSYEDWMGSAVAVSQSGAVEIEGGTYTGLYAFASLNGGVNPDGRITATDVTFSGSIENVNKTGGDGIISVNGTSY